MHDFRVGLLVCLSVYMCRRVRVCVCCRRFVADVGSPTHVLGLRHDHSSSGVALTVPEASHNQDIDAAWYVRGAISELPSVREAG